MNQITGAGLTRHFGDVVAVSSVDVAVDAGEVVGMVGANGSGKTTLIRMLLGLLPPTSGTVELLGGAPTREARARVGYVPQMGGLYDDLTVAENLDFTFAAYGGHGRATLPEDLAPTAGRLAGDLSLGLRRRAAFAIALAHDPELLVLDEPTSGVDPLASARLWDAIRGAVERGLGALVTTHHMSEAGQCDRLIVLAAGRVVAHGTQRQIVGDTQVVEVQTEDWERVFEALDAAGALVSIRGRTVRVIDRGPDEVQEALARAHVEGRVSLEPATLDETFVRLTADSPA